MKRIGLLCITILLSGLIWDGYDNYTKEHTVSFRTTHLLLVMPPSEGTKKALDDRLKSE